MDEIDGVLEPVVVAVRIHPHSHNENGKNIITDFPDEPKVLLVAGKGFAFDYVFTEKCEQATVYEEIASPLVKKLCDGFNCAVIAYGQTGTGKTFTIGTDPKTSERDSAGIISRAIQDVLSNAGSEGLVISVKISFMEIYNEDVYDLLVSHPTKLQVTGFNVQHLTQAEMTTFEEAIELLKFGSSNRHTRATKLNAYSSRSHAIFTIYYQQQIGNQVVESRLDVVDLAGSEGVRNTGSRDVALREANNINRGLLHLRNIISILSENSRDFPSYRSSTLTTVLKDSLSKGSYCSMIVCISPSELDLGQTVTTLRFAEEVKKVMTKPKMKKILDKHKALNPQAFEVPENISRNIPPTPLKCNLYKMDYIQGSNSMRKPLMPLHNINSFSSSEMLDMRKRHLNTLNESSSTCSTFSTSTNLDASTMSIQDITSILSPLFKRHMERMEERLEEKLKTVVRTGLQRNDLENKEGSLHSEQTSCCSGSVRQPSQQNDDIQTLKNIKCQLEYGDSSTQCNQEDSHPQSCSATPEDYWNTSSCSNVPTILRRSLRLKKGNYNADASVFSPSKVSTVIRKSARLSHRTQKHYTHEASVFSPSSASTVRRSVRLSRRAEKQEIDEASVFCPPRVSTVVRRSSRLSCRKRKHSTDDTSILSPSEVSTVYRRTRLSNKPQISPTDDTSVLSPSEVSTVCRRTRLSNKPQISPTDCMNPLQKIRRRLSMKPALMVSPILHKKKTEPAKVRERFKQKVLKLLNGSLKDLCQLATVGPKTALLIYNYRMLNDCQFKSLEDLKEIPGLSKSYFTRFVNANNLF